MPKPSEKFMPKPSDNEAPSGEEDPSRAIARSLKSTFKSFYEKVKSKIKLKSQATHIAKNSLATTTGKHIATTLSEGQIAGNIKGFTEKVVEDILIPRSDIISASTDVTLQELSKIVIEHTHTRTLIYEKELDNIVGFVHIKDLFEVIANSREFNLKSLTRKHIIAPCSLQLADLLAQMQKKRTHIAVVVDEYGGTDGIVTIEDLIEELVGEIDDEHDTDHNENSFELIKPGLLVTSARAEVSELERFLGVKFKKSDDEFITIGGLLMAKSGHVPAKGVVMNITDNIIAEVLERTPRTIKKIKITYDKDQ
ncbi:MAG: hypothetical protein COA94_01775 [Rickettsiales bacterium]|nr:MAG: hypothetical protein COA94_01775 [Rickettsiales bacterium]